MPELVFKIVFSSRRDTLISIEKMLVYSSYPLKWDSNRVFLSIMFSTTTNQKKTNESKIQTTQNKTHNKPMCPAYKTDKTNQNERYKNIFKTPIFLASKQSRGEQLHTFSAGNLPFLSHNTWGRSQPKTQRRSGKKRTAGESSRKFKRFRPQIGVYHSTLLRFFFFFSFFFFCGALCSPLP